MQRLYFLICFYSHLFLWPVLAADSLLLSGMGDAGSIPKLQNLKAKLGVSVAITSQNFDSVGDRLDVRLNGVSAKFSEVRFFTEAEYGMAENWALTAQASALTSHLNAASGGETLATGGGLSDFLTSVKYQFKTTQPQLTAEAKVKFPTGSSRADGTDELVVGDGSFDLTGVLHLGYEQPSWKVSLSSGLMGRSSGFAPVWLSLGSADFIFSKGYLRAFGESVVSLQEALLTDSSADIHDALGSGGSQLRLAGSPSFFRMGAQLGFRLFQEYFFEARAAQTAFGVRAPHYFQMGFQLRGTWDFFTPETRKKVKEIPLESDGKGKFSEP